MVAWWHGGMVAWWHGGMVAWWHGGKICYGTARCATGSRNITQFTDLVEQSELVFDDAFATMNHEVFFGRNGRLVT